MSDFIFTYCTRCMNKTYHYIEEKLNNGNNIVKCNCGISKIILKNGD